MNQRKPKKMNGLNLKKNQTKLKNKKLLNYKTNF